MLSDINAERLNLISEISGADSIVNSSTHDLEAQIKDLTSGQGADKLIVACASGVAQEQALRMVAKRGTVSMFGFTHKEWPWIKFDSNDCHYREFLVTGVFAYSRKQFKMALDLLARGMVKTEQLNTRVFALDRVVEALETMKQGIGLKILVTNKEI